MQPEVQRFLRAIAEKPADLDLRLVFADWLDERGDPRGEFIRAQCELERLGEDDPRRGQLEVRAEDLLAEHEQQWAGAIGELATRWTFRRGFIEAIETDVDAFRRHSATLIATYPVVHVRFHGQHGELVEDEDVCMLADTPALARLTGIELPHVGGGLTCDAIEALIRSRHLGPLTWLELDCLDDESGYGLGPRRAELVARSSRLANLTTLKLNLNCISDEGVETLARSRHLKQLTALHLAGNFIEPDGLEFLTTSKKFAHLRELEIGWNDFGYPELSSILDSPTLQSVSALHLDHSEVVEGDNNFLATLGASPRSARFVALSLRRNELDANTLEPLVLSPHLARLRRLDVADNKLKDAGADSLARSPHLGSLAFVNLSHNEIGQAGVRSLSVSPYLQRLTALDLSHNPIADQGLLALIESPLLGRIRSLNLAKTGITVAGLRQLAEAPGVRELRSLDLSWNDFGDKGLSVLIHSPHFLRLRELHIKGVACPTDSLARLPRSARFPRLATVTCETEG